MLYLWKTTRLGKIWLDGDAVKVIISKRLPKELYIQEVSFVGDGNLLNVYIATPEDTSSDVKSSLEARFGSLFANSGIEARLNWLAVSPQDNKKTTPLWTLPLFWAGVAAAVTALFHMGFKGALWSVVSAVAGYGVSWIFVTEDGKKQVAALQEHFRR